MMIIIINRGTEKPDCSRVHVSFYKSFNRIRLSICILCDKLFDRMIISLSVVPFNVCRDRNTLRKSTCLVSVVNRRLVNVCPVLKS